MRGLTVRAENVKYDELKFKIPVESATYREDSEFVVRMMLAIPDNGSSVLTGNIDVKATSDGSKNSSRSPNITSFSRIRTAYVTDPYFMFIVLSIQHKIYSERNKWLKE